MVNISKHKSREIIFNIILERVISKQERTNNITQHIAQIIAPQQHQSSKKTQKNYSMIYAEDIVMIVQNKKAYKKMLVLHKEAKESRT